MAVSGRLKTGERRLRILGTLAVVLLDSANRLVGVNIKASSNHNPVLKFNTTSMAENEDNDTKNIYSETRSRYYTIHTRSHMAN